MTEENGGGPVAPPNLISKLSLSELLIGGGAAWIFVVVFIVGNRLTADYSTSVAVIGALLSLIVLGSAYAAKMDKGGLGTLYPWIAVTATWGIVVFVALDVLNGLTNEFVGSFYEATVYLAAAAGGVGAYLHGQGK